MSTSRTITLIIATLCCFCFFSAFTARESVAATYYVAPNGSNSGAGSIDSPWATFDHTMDHLQPGDVLVLKDGVYKQSLNIKVSGTSGKPITIKAQTDGSAVVDGDFIRTPFQIGYRNYITVEGIYFKESNFHVIDIKMADNLIFRRVTASDCINPEVNYHVWRLDGVTNSLFEDCAGWGNGRNTMLIYKPSHHVTVRRFYGRYHDKQSSHGPVVIQIYGSHDCLLENVIITYDGQGTWGSPTEYYLSGINIWDNNQSSTYNNKIYGCVVYDLNMGNYPAQDYGVEAKSFQTYGNKWLNNVSVNNMHGIVFSNDRTLTATNLTIANNVAGVVFRDNYENPATDYLNLTNSIIVNSRLCGFDFYPADTPSGGGSSILHTYNTFYNNATQFYDGSHHPTENNVNPAFDTESYGYGAYLVRPSALSGLGKDDADIGAEVLYCYEDGILTDIPLWPWPLEDRIHKELGISVTMKANGGIWKTLDNVYPLKKLVPPVPPVPTGLKVN